MTGTLNANPQSCAVPTGASTCNTTLSWTTSNPVVTSAITLDGTAGDLYVGNNNAGQLTAVPYEVDGSVVYRLYNNAAELASTSVAVTCAAGVNKWDTMGSVCANPLVDSAVVTGDYYSDPATIDFTCIDSTGYEVIFDPALQNISIKSGAYVGETLVSTKQGATNYGPGDYKVLCKHGSVSDSRMLQYHFPAPGATVSIDAYPKTIDSGGKSTLSWMVSFPTGACTLTAHAVCANNICTSSQEAAANTINYILANGTTDPETPGEQVNNRSIVSAVNTIAPGHTNTDHKALGKKTLTIKSSTDFTVDCGVGKTATTRVRTVSSNEQ
jgi:hypothetical protein